MCLVMHAQERQIRDWARVDHAAQLRAQRRPQPRGGAAERDDLRDHGRAGLASRSADSPAHTITGGEMGPSRCVDGGRLESIGRFHWNAVADLGSPGGRVRRQSAGQPARNRRFRCWGEVPPRNGIRSLSADLRRRRWRRPVPRWRYPGPEVVEVGQFAGVQSYDASLPHRSTGIACCCAVLVHRARPRHKRAFNEPAGRCRRGSHRSCGWSDAAPGRDSRSTTTTVVGRRVVHSRATARPTIPAPTTTRS